MAPDGPAGMGGFFQGMLGDLLRLLKTDAPLQWDLAVQLAEAVASEGEPSANVEPVERMRLEELGRIAEMHVADVTGMTTTSSGRHAVIVPLTKAEWARRSLEGWRPIFERVAQALAPGKENPTATAVELIEDEQESGELAEFMNQWASALGPAMIGMQIGSIMGHLARRSLGQYDLPLPRPDSDSIFVVATNARGFAEDWSLPVDDVALYLGVKDLTMHTILTRAHVRARLEDLIVAHPRGFRPDRHALESLLGEVSPGELGDIGALTQILSDPAALGSLADTPELRRANAELDALVTTIVGYSEHVLDTVASRAIGARLPVREAIKRRRIERSEEDRGVEALLGLRLDQDVFDRGEAFVAGVLERGGDADLATMFVIEANLPTPAELTAPGLWLERIHLPAPPSSNESDS